MMVKTVSVVVVANTIYVGMTQVQSGVLYIEYRGTHASMSEKQGKKPIDYKYFAIQV